MANVLILFFVFFVFSLFSCPITLFCRIRQFTDSQTHGSDRVIVLISRYLNSRLSAYMFTCLRADMPTCLHAYIPWDLPPVTLVTLERFEQSSLLMRGTSPLIIMS